MRVAIFSYPMLFQRQGGLQIQVLETLDALRRLDIDAELFDWRSSNLSEYDLIHIFSALNGNHRVVESAVDAGVPVVLSSVLHSPTRVGGLIANICERAVGRVTNWQFQTTYRQIRTALDRAGKIIALGTQEAKAMVTGYGVDPKKIVAIPNGIAARFFAADPAMFRARYNDIGPFVLVVASISPYKNQLGVIESLKGSGLAVVLVGSCLNEHASYLEECLKCQDPVVHYIGSLPNDDPLLASAYAAAEVFVLASDGEVMPLVALEALAAGTPVVLTKYHGCDLHSTRDILAEVDPKKRSEIRDAVMELRGRRANPKALVQDLTWDSVAKQIFQVYLECRSAFRKY